MKPSELKTKNIIHNLKERTFDSHIISSLLPILEENISRVCFVKDLIDLDDILYFEEKDLHLIEPPLFFQQKNDTNKYETNNNVYYDLDLVLLDDIEKIKSELESFFIKTNRILYVNVGLKENVVTNDAIWDIFNEMKEDKDVIPVEQIFTKLEFPSWYEASTAKQIKLFKQTFILLKQKEKLALEKEMNHLENTINIHLEEDNFHKIPEILQTLKLLKKQRNESE
mgnify:CR=1 FL=1